MLRISYAGGICLHPYLTLTFVMLNCILTMLLAVFLQEVQECKCYGHT